MKKWNAASIRASKGVNRLACLTAYDTGSARLADAAGIALLLVGDSLGMTVLGYDSTLPVTMTDMLHHTAAVVRGAKDAMVVADMPFLSYQVNHEEAFRNAGRFIQEAGADAVKIEGGAIRAELVRTLTENGIPVLGHIGLTPQSINVLGGYKVQGKTRASCDRLIDDAQALAGAGAFAIVLECTPPDIGAAVTAAIPIPVIGVGAGPACDGQMLVMHDMLGLTERPPKFAKPYAALAATMRDAFAAYAAEVQSGSFPAPEHCYAPASF
ncbi:MAG TPA: 3-methyl-2-oxobutanoate hydroxymethyltransferase [Kiritimatiellia bacterium]|nr:3-methyl-2-oxobutanoate hydroxymethyltransferase [Kiritimatiellia bacterium]HRU69588.1 3-methyl-2-oxobutanoate hydroxymethyltransferase [Kiritimatiellia bacterium]